MSLQQCACPYGLGSTVTSKPYIQVAGKQFAAHKLHQIAFLTFFMCAPSRQRVSVCVQTPNFNALSGVSLAAAFMSLSYSTIAFAGSLNVGQQPGVLSVCMCIAVDQLKHTCSFLQLIMCQCKCRMVRA